MGSDAPQTDEAHEAQAQVQAQAQAGDSPTAAGQSERAHPDASSSVLQSRAQAPAGDGSIHSTFPDPFQAVAGASPVFHIRQPSSAGLSIYTGNAPDAVHSGLLSGSHGHSQHVQQSLVEARPRKSSSLSRPPLSSTRSFDGTSVLSPASSISSPMLSSLTDVTPLPSPIFPPTSPDLWKRVAEKATRSRGNSAASLARDDALLGPSALSQSPSRRKKPYHGLRQKPGSAGSVSELAEAGHGGIRSTSEYTPETLQNVRPRNITLPASDILAAVESKTAPVQAESRPLVREKDYAHRQATPVSAHPSAIESLPTPPPSDKSTTDSEESQELQDQVGPLQVLMTKHQERRDFAAVRRLGTGSFSEVVLASDRTSAGLCAVKIVKHDPDAKDDERMEMSIKREIEMLQEVSHPSLPQILGFEDLPTRALVVLAYCEGGDLFDLATQRRDLLGAATIQRVFAELVDAVSYLHSHDIVHRDIKLENVLCNISLAELERLENVRTHPSAIMTLTDLGLSRHIDPKSPLLSHPCGSTDYAAPEILLGQAYDGRSTDAWALGVLLYALLEGRLPFDPLPGKRNTGNVKHRIARCDWLWCTYGDQYGDWVEEKGAGLEGAREVVEGLLKKAGRGRWSLDKVKEHAWVKQGIQVDGKLMHHRS